MPQWKVGGVRLPDGPYMISAGVCKTPARTAEWLKVVPVVSGSYTPEQRDGNPGKVAYPESLEEFLRLGHGLNSYGMPNMGFVAAARQFEVMDQEQPLMVSVAGFSVDDYVRGAALFARLPNVSAIELNLGCPNTQGDHPDIMSFNPGAVRKILETLSALQGGLSKPIWLKFSPYSNPAELKRMAELVNGFKDDLGLTVVTCNTFPNAYAGDRKITPNNGMSGLSGPAMKQIALGQVKQFRQNLAGEIDVIGIGGITTGDHIMDFLDAGAKAVQITSLAHWSGDPGSFFEQLLEQKTASRFMEHLTDDI
jgi:dihydroorotate dehydrogenase (fumarate)